MPFELDTTQEYILEDNRVLLRPLKLEDYENLLPFALNEPELWKYSLVTAAGEDGLANYLDIALEARTARKEYPFIVFDKSKKRVRRKYKVL